MITIAVLTRRTKITGENTETSKKKEKRKEVGNQAT